MPLPSDQVPLCQGIDPQHPEKTAAFYLSVKNLEKVRRAGPAGKYHDNNLLEAAIGAAEVVFRGLKRPGKDDCFCLCALPSQRYDNDGELTDRNQGRVFAVYFELCPYGYLVFDWEWRPGNEKTGHPYESEKHLGEKAWSRR